MTLARWEEAHGAVATGVSLNCSLDVEISTHDNVHHFKAPYCDLTDTHTHTQLALKRKLVARSRLL